ncbi:MAG: MBL fold metallo-hydrolase [Anaerolineae bacterium]|nr:MAG: MBL fold metallo-hydrolase [Anaerolineae bacterium]
MIRERVSENVYVFTSEVYAQVNAGAVVGPDYTVLIDTLAFPDEIQEIKRFTDDRLGRPVRFIINTHYHTDHTLGNSFFPRATIISHALCRDFLDKEGRKALQVSQESNRELRDVRIRLPNVTFEKGSATVRVGKRTLQIMPLPGHSADGVGVLVLEDRVLFSGDVMMPIPYLADGDYELMVASLKSIPRMRLENLVQGHGESILRGEVGTAVRANLSYLAAVRRHVQTASRRKDSLGYLAKIGIEDCGKSRILMNGFAEDLHARNLIALYQMRFGGE